LSDASPPLLLIVLGLLLAASGASAQPRLVALTFDDLPFADPGHGDPRADQARALRASKAIQRALRRHGAPAIGFVNEGKVQNLGKAGVAVLRSWNAGPFELGNHGFAHADSNALSLPQIEEEIDKGERTIKPLAERAGRPLRFYRFGFNHVGDTEERRGAIEQLLARRGYRLAASTIDTSDYVFAGAYDRALTGRDKAMQARIEQAYLAYTRQQIDYYGALDAKVLGRQPPEIIVLHLSSLNGATIEPILEAFEARNYRFVTLEQAQSDPAYARPPAVATRFGPMWGYRWARERGVKVDGSLEKEPPQWVSAYAKGK